jgi:molybdate transport system substrate-binding protein
MLRLNHRRGAIVKPWLVLSGLLIAIAILVFGLWRLTWQSPGETLVLLCAAGPSKAVQEICTDYERQYGVKISIEPDNSGRLLSRLRVTPQRFDLYIASDESFMRDAQDEKLVRDVRPVVRQHAVVGVAKGNPHNIHSLDDLLKDNLRIVLADPKLAAVSESVERALKGTGQWQVLLDRQRGASRVSTVTTVAEAAQAVKIGAADAAFVWDATARQFDLDFVELPELQARTQERVVLGVVAASPHVEAALRLARYLTARDRGQKVFEKYYYQPMEDADVWKEGASP